MRNQAGWKAKHFKGMTLEDIKEKFDPVWKHIQDFIPISSKEEVKRFKRKGLRLDSASYQFFVDTLKHLDREDLNQLWTLVKETLNIRPALIDPHSGTSLTFDNTHNMIAFLTKSDASKGFEQIIDFLNTSVIQYALVVNPTIYVACIKQFWSSVSLKKTNDVVRLQALIDRRKVIITEDTVRQVLRLDNADSIDYLPNEEIFIELARMGYEKPSTKLTFYKAFFSAQWKFLIHTILQCMSAKRTAWNEFTLLAMWIAPLKFYMYPRFLQLMINAQIADLSSHTTKYISHALTQKVFANMRRVGKGFSGVDTPLFDGMKVENLEQDKIAQALEITKLKQRVRRLEKKRKLKALGFKRLRKGEIVELDANEDVTLEEVAAKVTNDTDDDEAEPAELKEVIEVVTTPKLMTEVVTTAATTITVAPMPKASALRRRRGVIIHDPKEIATPSIIVHSEPKSKDKGKGILVKEAKPLKRQAQIEQDEAYARELEAKLNANINWNEVIEQVKRKEKQYNKVMRYQSLKRKPVTEAQARKNIMVYLKNMAGFKMDFFKAGSRDHPPMLVTGRYPQWHSRFLRYVNTRPNSKALRKCILSGSYKPTTVLVYAVEATDNSPAVHEHTTVKTPANMSPKNKAHFLAEKEAIHLILNGIGDDIYSTVDACQMAQEI
nr:hypothetical protein [Tanacetum cinerariifolium]